MYIKVIIILSTLFILRSNLHAGEEIAADDDHHSAGWITAGIGNCYFGPTILLGLTYAYNDNLFSFRYLNGDEYRFSEETIYDEPVLSFTEAGILYGHLFRKEYMALGLSTGISIIKGVGRGNQIEYHKFERKEISTFGVPFDMRVRFELGHFGIGVSWFGNINAKRTISGVMFEVSVGIF